ncbi:MAG: GSCFA domain-containing protein [Betaproteobacteria bacterium]
MLALRPPGRALRLLIGVFTPLFRKAADLQQANIRAHLGRRPHAATTHANILLIGNCQVQTLALLMQAMLGGARVDAIMLVPAAMACLAEPKGAFADLIENADLIFFHPHDDALALFRSTYPAHAGKIRLMPRITSSMFHPDSDYVEHAGGRHMLGPLGGYHSVIVFYGWQNGLSARETLGLFREDVFRALGYFDYARAATASLLAEGERTGISLAPLVERWSRQGCWMYSINHPKPFVLADVARLVLARENIATLPGADVFVEDVMSTEPAWPVYPEVASRFGFEGSYLFKYPADPVNRAMDVLMLTLPQFIEASYAVYAAWPKDTLTCPRLSLPAFADLKSRVIAITGEQAPGAPGATDNKNGSSPYQELPDHQFWRRAVERIPVADINPVVNPRFCFSAQHKVATAGSCFAQHLSRALVERGFHYYVAEAGGEMSVEESSRRNYGVFSARCGNVYTARQLLQLFDRAHARMVPLDQAWVRGDGRWVDPFRPQVEPDGFESIVALEASRAEHFAAVRTMFEELDVFVFTLGLTEAWRRCEDGAIFPLAPGVAGGDMSAGKYEFVNFSVNQVVADLQGFLDRLHTINPTAKILLTVSPVPLIATYEAQHVLVATTYSKAVLRAAADEVARRNPACDYFPSFEIITGNFSRGQYFDDDLRSIKPEGVDHVMRVFMSSYAGENGQKDMPSFVSPADVALNAQFTRLNDIVCEEESIDPR